MHAVSRRGPPVGEDTPEDAQSPIENSRPRRTTSSTSFPANSSSFGEGLASAARSPSHTLLRSDHPHPSLYRSHVRAGDATATSPCRRRTHARAGVSLSLRTRFLMLRRIGFNHGARTTERGAGGCHDFFRVF